MVALAVPTRFGSIFADDTVDDNPRALSGRRDVNNLVEVLDGVLSSRRPDVFLAWSLAVCR